MAIHLPLLTTQPHILIKHIQHLHFHAFAKNKEKVSRKAQTKTNALAIHENDCKNGLRSLAKTEPGVTFSDEKVQG